MLSDKHREFLYLIPLVGLLAFFCINSLTAPIGDFGNYYYASQLLAEGKWGGWVYDKVWFNTHIYLSGQRNFFLNYTPVPPVSAIFYLPLTIFSTAYAKLIFNLLGASLFVFSALEAQRVWKFKSYFFLLIPVFFYMPIRSNIFEGQSYFFVLFFLIKGFAGIQKDQTYQASLLWSIPIVLKIFPAFVMLYLLCNKQFKIAWSVFCWCAILVLITLPCLGYHLWQTYLTEVLPRLFSGEINSLYAASYQSFQVMMRMLLIPDAMHQVSSSVAQPILFKRVLLLFQLLVIIPVCWATLFTNQPPMRKIAWWVLLSFLISGYGTVYSMVLLLIFLSSFHQKEFKHIWICVILLQLPYYWFNDLPVVLKFPRFYLLLALYLFMLPWSEITACWKAIPVLILPFILIKKTTYQQNHYLLKQELSLLTGDIQLEGNRLKMVYFDNKGWHQQYMVLKDNIINPQEVRLCFDKTKETISKAIRINQHQVVYLSDRNRGVGFYAPMIIDERVNKVDYLERTRLDE